jgi:predicted transcriptional regulator
MSHLDDWAKGNLQNHLIWDHHERPSDVPYDADLDTLHRTLHSGVEPPPDTKAITLRLDQQLADELDMLARIDHCSKNEVVRRALRAYINSRRADPEFQSRVREKIARAAALARQIEGAAP